MDEGKQVTVAQLIELLRTKPQEALVFVECDYASHRCEGVLEHQGGVWIQIG